jgi:hypothetical protein
VREEKSCCQSKKEFWMVSIKISHPPLRRSIFLDGNHFGGEMTKAIDFGQRIYVFLE